MLAFALVATCSVILVQFFPYVRTAKTNRLCSSEVQCTIGFRAPVLGLLMVVREPAEVSLYFVRRLLTLFALMVCYSSNESLTVLLDLVEALVILLSVLM